MQLHLNQPKFHGEDFFIAERPNNPTGPCIIAAKDQDHIDAATAGFDATGYNGYVFTIYVLLDKNPEFPSYYRFCTDSLYMSLVNMFSSRIKRTKFDSMRISSTLDGSHQCMIFTVASTKKKLACRAIIEFISKYRLQRCCVVYVTEVRNGNPGSQAEKVFLQRSVLENIISGLVFDPNNIVARTEMIQG